MLITTACNVIEYRTEVNFLSLEDETFKIYYWRRILLEPLALKLDHYYMYLQDPYYRKLLIASEQSFWLVLEGMVVIFARTAREAKISEEEFSLLASNNYYRIVRNYPLLIKKKEKTQKMWMKYRSFGCLWKTSSSQIWI